MDEGTRRFRGGDPVSGTVRTVTRRPAAPLDLPARCQERVVTRVAVEVPGA